MTIPIEYVVMHPNCADPCPMCDAEAGIPSDGMLIAMMENKLPDDMRLSQLRTLMPAFRQLYLVAMVRHTTDESGCEPRE